MNARSATGASELNGVLARLREGGLDVRLHRTSRPGEIASIVRSEAADVEHVIVGGGDGTLHAALPAVLRSGRPLGVIPLGTANDFARTMGLPLEPEEACAAIVGGSQRLVDVGTVNGEPFLNVASIGLGVAVTRRMAGLRKSRWGVFSYPRALADALRGLRSFRARIRCDGRERTVRSIQIAVGNGRYYGGGVPVAEDAAIDDGRLDLFSIEPRGWLHLLAHAPALRLGRQHRAEGVQSLRGCAIDIETVPPRSITADGELHGRTPARFRVHARALSVHVLEPASD